MPRVWLSFGLVCLPLSFSVPFFLWSFVASLVYVLYNLSFLVNILLFIDQKKKKCILPSLWSFWILVVC